MPTPTSYVLCGTPRTGSTLLCSHLASTGVAGRPQSYFRAPDLTTWARRFGVPVDEDGRFDFDRFVAGAVRVGSTDNGVFAARVMWGTMSVLVEGLDPRPSGRRDVDVLQHALGPLRFVHLRRQDVVGQAVSWARAEQSGYWQHGDRVSADPRFDLDQVGHLVDTIAAHEAAWQTWFAAQSVEPLEVTYEDVVARPGNTVGAILAWIGVEPPTGWTPVPQHEQQADETNAEWARRYRAARG